MVTHQLQVERRTAKAYRPKTNALPLDHATNRGIFLTSQHQESYASSDVIELYQLYSCTVFHCVINARTLPQQQYALTNYSSPAESANENLSKQMEQARSERKFKSTEKMTELKPRRFLAKIDLGSQSEIIGCGVGLLSRRRSSCAEPILVLCAE